MFLIASKNDVSNYYMYYAFLITFPGFKETSFKHEIGSCGWIITLQPPLYSSYKQFCKKSYLVLFFCNSLNICMKVHEEAFIVRNVKIFFGLTLEAPHFMRFPLPLCIIDFLSLLTKVGRHS